MEDYSKRSNSVQDVIPMIFGMGAQIPDATRYGLPAAFSARCFQYRYSGLYLIDLGGEDVNTRHG